MTSTGARLRSTGLPGDLALYAGSLLFAAVTATTSHVTPHAAWGALAAWGYGAGVALVTVQLFLALRGARPRARAHVLAVVAATAVALPMLIEVLQRAHGSPDRAVGEVGVIEGAGARLIHGALYLTAPQLDAAYPRQGIHAYLPYQPVMALFGLPHALAGSHWWTDPRLGFVVVAAAAVTVALRLAIPESRHRLRAVQAVTVLPCAALALATGGDDLPVLAFCLLSLALAARERWAWAGAAVGLAVGMKLTAVPIGCVILLYAYAKYRPRLRPFGAATAAAGLVATAAIAPGLFPSPTAMVENVVRFPLGLTRHGTPAKSPLPGWWIAHSMPSGRLVAIGLLGAAGLALLASLARRPPRDAAQTAAWAAAGLATAFVLAPSTRFGYVVYPAALAMWAYALRAP